MSRFCSLFSGSSGNCTYIGSAKSGVLIDAGVSCRSILTALKDREIERESVKALFITHEHIDHIKGVRVLLKNTDIRLFATVDTINYLADKNELPVGAKVNAIDMNTTVTVDDIEVQPFLTSHDSISSCGYTLALPDGRTAAVATDLGYVSEDVQRALTGVDLVLLESNYDSSMLNCSPYPYYLKRRIASDLGHLSNESCAREALRLVKSGTTRLILGHLSKENNMPILAYETIKSELEMAQIKHGGDYLLSVAKRCEPSEMIVF